MLLTSTFFLFALIFFLGLLIGLNVERSDLKNRKQVEAVESASDKKTSVPAGTTAQTTSNNSELVTETKLKPASPGFKEVSPTAELPKISKPKTE